VDSWALRVEDFRRHVADLQIRGYEGRISRADRDAMFRGSFALLDPLALQVLQEMNDGLLGGSGDIEVRPPQPDGTGGTAGSWSLSWPLQRSARNRLTETPLLPVTIGAVFPEEWTHAHLAARVHAGIHGLIGWPLQVVNTTDARRQVWILRAIAEAELHDRIYEADVNWRIIPEAEPSS
jgi:hypothetical protein